MLGAMDRKIIIARALERAEQRVLEGGRLIAQQNELIANLSAAGLDASAFRDTLVRLEQAQSLRVQSASKLRQDLLNTSPTEGSISDAIPNPTQDRIDRVRDTGLCAAGGELQRRQLETDGAELVGPSSGVRCPASRRRLSRAEFPTRNVIEHIAERFDGNNPAPITFVCLARVLPCPPACALLCPARSRPRAAKEAAEGRRYAPAVAQPQDDSRITLARLAEPVLAIPGRPIEPDPDEAVRSFGGRGVIQLRPRRLDRRVGLCRLAARTASAPGNPRRLREEGSVNRWRPDYLSARVHGPRGECNRMADGGNRGRDRLAASRLSAVSGTSCQTATRIEQATYRCDFG